MPTVLVNEGQLSPNGSEVSKQDVQKIGHLNEIMTFSLTNLMFAEAQGSIDAALKLVPNGNVKNTLIKNITAARNLANAPQTIIQSDENKQQFENDIGEFISLLVPLESEANGQKITQYRRKTHFEIALYQQLNPKTKEGQKIFDELAREFVLTELALATREHMPVQSDATTSKLTSIYSKIYDTFNTEQFEGKNNTLSALSKYYRHLSTEFANQPHPPAPPPIGGKTRTEKPYSVNDFTQSTILQSNDALSQAVRTNDNVQLEQLKQLGQKIVAQSQPFDTHALKNEVIAYRAKLPRDFQGHNLHTTGNMASTKIAIEGYPEQTAVAYKPNDPNLPIDYKSMGLLDIHEPDVHYHTMSLRGEKKPHQTQGTLYPRAFDSEATIVRNLAVMLKDNPNATGVVNIFSERAACDSCLAVMGQFAQDHPNIRFNIMSNNDVVLHEENIAIPQKPAQPMTSQYADLLEAITPNGYQQIVNMAGFSGGKSPAQLKKEAEKAAQKAASQSAQSTEQLTEKYITAEQRLPPLNGRNDVLKPLHYTKENIAAEAKAQKNYGLKTNADAPYETDKLSPQRLGYNNVNPYTGLPAPFETPILSWKSENSDQEETLRKQAAQEVVNIALARLAPWMTDLQQYTEKTPEVLKAAAIFMTVSMRARSDLIDLAAKPSYQSYKKQVLLTPYNKEITRLQDFDNSSLTEESKKIFLSVGKSITDENILKHYYDMIDRAFFAIGSKTTILKEVQSDECFEYALSAFTNALLSEPSAAIIKSIAPLQHIITKTKAFLNMHMDNALIGLKKYTLLNNKEKVLLNSEHYNSLNKAVSLVPKVSDIALLLFSETVATQDVDQDQTPIEGDLINDDQIAESISWPEPITQDADEQLEPLSVEQNNEGKRIIHIAPTQYEVSIDRTRKGILYATSKLFETGEIVRGMDERQINSLLNIRELLGSVKSYEELKYQDVIVNKRDDLQRLLKKGLHIEKLKNYHNYGNAVSIRMNNGWRLVGEFKKDGGFNIFEVSNHYKHTK